RRIGVGRTSGEREGASAEGGDGPEGGGEADESGRGAHGASLDPRSVHPKTRQNVRLLLGWTSRPLTPRRNRMSRTKIFAASALALALAAVPAGADTVLTIANHTDAFSMMGHSTPAED